MEQIVAMDTVTELTTTEVEVVSGAFFPLVAAFALGFGAGSIFNHYYYR